eukprot:2247703-Amphidinium_carterae.1
MGGDALLVHPTASVEDHFVSALQAGLEMRRPKASQTAQPTENVVGRAQNRSRRSESAWPMKNP